MKHSQMLLFLLLLPLLHVFTAEGQSEPCNEKIINEPWKNEGLLIRYNQNPCSEPLLWFPFCENSGWGDNEANVVCRELGYAYGVGGFSTTYQGAQGYASIACEGTESRLDECAIEAVDLTRYCSQVGVAVCNDIPQVYIPEPTDRKQVSEEPVELCIAIRGVVEETVQVLVETSSNGSALANFDYVPVRSTITFGPSHPSEQCLEIDIIDDSLAEGQELFTLLLSSPRSAINITDDTFLIIIEPNDFESETCTEGSATLVSDSNGNRLQLVEMCSSEGVWSPVCDYDWTLQDATVVCRELGEDNGAPTAEVLVQAIYMGTVFPECSGNETRLEDCLTTTTSDEMTCNHVLVDCNAEETADVERIDFWMVVSSVIVATIFILIIVIVVGLVAVTYSRWNTARRGEKSESPAVDSNSYCASTLPVSLQLENGDYNMPTEIRLDTLSVENTPITSDPSQPPSCLSEAAEHHLINPLYGETDEPPPTTQDGVEHYTMEPHYDLPHASPTTDTIIGVGDALKHHKYEYIENSVAKP